MMQRRLRRSSVGCLIGLTIFVASVEAHDGTGASSGPAVKEQKAWGIAGDAKPGLRTIRISMSDKMRFTPDRVSVKLGETVRFVLKNDGKLMHEFMIGTQDELDQHAALMKKYPRMEHDEPFMTHVAPGKTGEIVWTFNRPGDFRFACLIAGHYEAGMIGTITVNERKPAADR